MKQNRNAYSIMNTIRMELNSDSGENHVWLLVEGETDQKLFSKLVIDGNFVKVRSVGGNMQLRKALSVLIKETDRVLGICDADFLHLDKKTESINCLFLTDYHDIEMMLIACDAAFQSVVSEYLNSYLNDFKNLRSVLFKSISFLGGIRWLNNKEHLELNFNGLGLSEFYDNQSLALDPKPCIETIHNRSPNRTRDIRIDDVLTQIGGNYDYLNFCNGHDFEKAFASHSKELTKRNVRNLDVGKALRMAYRKEDFSQTQLFLRLKEWEEEKGYHLVTAS